MKMRLAQISDIHIGEKCERSFHIDPKEQFIKTLANVTTSNPDAILVTGDLCLDEIDPHVNPWVKQHLDKTGIPYYVVSGNHDDSIDLANTFHPSHLKKRELYFRERIGEEEIIFLDSSRAKFTKAQWSWLEEQLHEGCRYIVCHYPPIYAGVPHMDSNHPFIEQDRFMEVITQFNREFHLFSGHYHTARYLRHENLHIHIAPSTLFQINFFKSEFDVASTQPGYQLIDFFDNRLTTTIIWVNV